MGKGLGDLVIKAVIFDFGQTLVDSIDGFKSAEKEAQALFDFIRTHDINMIQWRNLNFDPRQYTSRMAAIADSGPPLGMARLIQTLKQKFPHLIHGYFNPPKERFQGKVKELTGFSP